MNRASEPVIEKDPAAADINPRVEHGIRLVPERIQISVDQGRTVNGIADNISVRISVF